MPGASYRFYRIQVTVKITTTSIEAAYSKIRSKEHLLRTPGARYPVYQIKPKGRYSRPFRARKL